MSFNGSGTFNINTTGQPVVNGTTISSTVFNALTADLATGLSTTLTKDGQSLPTANISLNNFKLTNVGTATLGTDAVNLTQLQTAAATALTVSGTDTLTGSLTPALTAYANGALFKFLAVATNTGPMTLNVNSLGAKAITRDGTTALVAGDVTSNKEMVVVYDGTQFQVINSNSVTSLRVTGSGNVVTAEMQSGGNGLVVVGAGGTGATLSTSQTSGNTNFWRLGQTGVLNWDIRNVGTTGEFRITNGAQIPFSSSSTGNVTINAPSSGTALTVTGLVKSLGSAGDNFSCSDGTTATSLQQNGNYFYFNNNVDSATTGGFIWRTTSSYTERMRITNTGNVTINAPTSGAALSVTGQSGYVAGQFIANGTSGNSYGLLSQGGTTSADYGLRVNNNAASVMFEVGGAGNVAINAPSSGTALTLSGLASNYAMLVNDTGGKGLTFRNATNTTGFDMGLLGGSGDATAYVLNRASSNLMLGAGNATRIQIAPAGNVTVNAPTSGTALAITPQVGYFGLEVNAASTGDAQISLNSNARSSATGLQIYQSSSGTAWIANGDTTHGMNFSTNGTSRVQIAYTGNTNFDGAASTAPVAVTFNATTMTINCRLSNVFTTTFTANVTTAPTYSTPQDGQTINWFITQDATGTRTMTWGTSVKWPGGSAGVLSTAANSVDLVVMTYRSSTGFWYASLAKAFA